jgi:alpha-L-rhamnosidase
MISLPFSVLRGTARGGIFAGFLFASLAAAQLRADDAPMTVADLRCDSRVDPSGIDDTAPRFSWQLQSAARGARQTAYQVLVASSPDLLTRDTGDWWGSGIVKSDQSLGVTYQGKPLTSGAQVFWKVRVWDGNGVASAWSAPAQWSMGLLDPTDWKGQWIGLDEPPRDETVTDADWIQVAAPPANSTATAANSTATTPAAPAVPPLNGPMPQRWFRKSFELPAGSQIAWAYLDVAADRNADVYLNGERLGHASSPRTATPFDVTLRLHSGTNVLAIVVNLTGRGSGPSGSLLAKLQVNTTTPAQQMISPPFVVTTDGSWRASTSALDGWSQPGFDDSAWAPATVLGQAGMAPWGEVAVADRQLPARWLRREFAVDKSVRRATVYLSGLGLSELYLNGQKVGDEVLSPGLSEYPKRDFYVTHDVTSLVQSGANAVGVVLGNGRFYAPRVVRTDTPDGAFGYPKLMFQLRLEYADGTTSDLVSDASWHLTTHGPILLNNEYDGESYDARDELTGWAQPGYDDSRWVPAQIVAPPGGVLAAQMDEPIRVTGVIKPVSVKEVQPGVFIYDFGQNMVGWCKLTVAGPRGTEVTLRHAESLQPDGSLYLDNIRNAEVTDRYVLKGGSVETWEPRFTYHGFRYVELRGYPGTPGLGTLEGHVVNDDLPGAGTFTTSNPLLNQIYHNILWGVRGNYRSIPTDCPQRDERMGWMGDRSSECLGESFLFDNSLLYSKWVQDMMDAQRADGSISDVNPTYWARYSDNVTWPATFIIAPGMLLDQYGDTHTLARAYPAMVKWVDHMNSYLTPDGLMPRDVYGDWCVPPENPAIIHTRDPSRLTAGPILASTTYYHCLQLLTRYATILGKPDDAARFTAEAEKLKAALNAKYLNTQLAQYDNGTQTSTVLPLAYDMVPAGDQARVFDHLVQKIHDAGDHIGTGVDGCQWLMRVLAENGRSDLAYTLATQRTFPSWGYMVDHGATTVWELWNGDTADPSMNSQNHVMLIGDLSVWLFEYLGGIQPDPQNPGFKHFTLDPHPVGDLTYVRATHRSPYGLITSNWSRTNGEFDWNVTVPPNSSATVSVPAATAADVTESGQPLAQAPGVTVLREENGRVVLDVGAGSYQFKAKSSATNT